MTDDAVQDGARVVEGCDQGCCHPLEDGGVCTNDCIRELRHDGDHMCRLHNVYGP